MAANVAVVQDPAGTLKPARDKSTERIDGIVAAIMAIGRAMVAQEEPQPEYSMFIVRRATASRGQAFVFALTLGHNQTENSHQPFRRREGAMAKYMDMRTLQSLAEWRQLAA